MLIATTSSESFMPAACWKAPLIPSARYNLGFTVFPEVPTRRPLSSQPLSTIGLEQEITPPNAAARASITGIFLSSLIPRPIETSISLAVISTSLTSGSTYLINLLYYLNEYIEFFVLL